MVNNQRPRNLGLEYWLNEIALQLHIEAVGRGITAEERAESTLHRSAVQKRLIK